MAEDKYTLYGVEASYYAAKVRCYLIQKPLPFDDLTAERKVFEEIIVPRIGYPIVPVVLTPEGDVLQDTAIIIEALEARHPKNPLIPTTPKKRFAAYLLELIADEWLKIPALHYRWCYDTEFAQQMMGQMNDPQASPEEQLRVGKKIAKEFSSWPKHLGADENTREAVELLFLENLASLDKHFSEHHFVLGNSPTLADCALMGPLYAHLYRDPYSGKIVREKAPHVCDWISRMRTPPDKAEPASNMAVDETNDEIPLSIVELIRTINQDYARMIQQAVQQTRKWISQSPNKELPRYLGEQPFVLATGKPYEAKGTRSIHAVEQWKFQRLLQKFDQESADNQHVVKVLCQQLGFSECVTDDMRLPINRRNFKLYAGNLH